MSLVCFDSNFVIWGVKRQASPGQEGNIPKAVYLLGELERGQDQILVPTIVLGEVLSALPQAQHAAFVILIERSFVLAPYDGAAAVQFARLWQQREPDAAFTRNETKADYMIAATAIVNGCKTIYSADKGLQRFAASHVPVVGIEEILVPPEQGKLLP